MRGRRQHRKHGRGVGSIGGGGSEQLRVHARGQRGRRLAVYDDEPRPRLLQRLPRAELKSVVSAPTVRDSRETCTSPMNGQNETVTLFTELNKFIRARRSKPHFGRNADCETSFTTKSGSGGDGGRRGYSSLLQGDPLNTNSGGGRKTSQQHRRTNSPDRRRGGGGGGGGTMQGSTSTQPLLSSDRSLDDDDGDGGGDDGCNGGGGEMGTRFLPPPLPPPSSSSAANAAPPATAVMSPSASGGSGCPTRPLPPTPSSSAVPSPMTPLDAGSLVMTPGIPPPSAAQR